MEKDIAAGWYATEDGVTTSVAHWLEEDDFRSNGGVMNHEIAHGFYYTNPQYKVEVDYLIGDINHRDYEHLKKVLIKGGYSDDKTIIDDEIQAYMSTGKHHEWKDSVYEKYSSEFIKIFKRFNK